MNSNKLGIAIITFNNIADTLSALSSVLISVASNTDIIVVDNKSDKAYKEKLAAEIKNGFAAVTLLYIDRDTGYGGACNIAAQELIKKGNSILLFLNNDVVLDKACIPNLLENFNEEGVAAAGPKIYLGFSRNIYCSGGFFGKNMIIKNRGYGKVDVGQYDKKEKVEFINGAVFMISANVFQKMGGFDEKFYYYCDETDLCWRMIKDGYSLIYDPRATAYHEASKTLGNRSSRTIYYMTRSTLYFADKHAKSRKIFYKTVLFVLYDFLFQTIRHKFREVFSATAAVFMGIYDFSRRKIDKGIYG